MAHSETTTRHGSGYTITGATVCDPCPKQWTGSVRYCYPMRQSILDCQRFATLALYRSEVFMDDSEQVPEVFMDGVEVEQR